VAFTLLAPSGYRVVQKRGVGADNKKFVAEKLGAFGGG